MECMSQPMTNNEVEEFVLECARASTHTSKDIIQSLWSGYGKIERWRLSGSEYKQIITKQVIPEVGDHPRGWNTDLSHQRKLKSYQVETNWYESIRNRDEPLLARTPYCLGTKKVGDQVLLVLEDLDASRICWPPELDQPFRVAGVCSLVGILSSGKYESVHRGFMEVGHILAFADPAR